MGALLVFFLGQSWVEPKRDVMRSVDLSLWN